MPKHRQNPVSLLAHLVRRGKVSYCHNNAFGALRPSTLESKIFKHLLLQNHCTSCCQISHRAWPRLQGFRILKLDQVEYQRWAPLLKIAKNNKTNFFTRTIRYNWLNISLRGTLILKIINIKNIHSGIMSQ